MNHPGVSIDSEHSTAVFSLDDFDPSADGSWEPKSSAGSVIEANNNNGEVYKPPQKTGLQSSNQNEDVTTAVARKKCQNDRPKRSRKTKSSGITYADLVPHFGQPSRDVAKTLGVSLSTFRSLCRKLEIPRWECTTKEKGLRRPSTPPPTGPMATMGEVNPNVPTVMPMFTPATSFVDSHMASKTSTSETQIATELKGKQALPTQDYDETEYLDGIGYTDMEALLMPDPYAMVYQGNQQLDGMQYHDTKDPEKFLFSPPAPPPGPMATMGEVNPNVPTVMPMFTPATSFVDSHMASKTSTSETQIATELKGKQALPMQDYDQTEYLDGIGYKDMEALLMPDPYAMVYQGNQQLDGMQYHDTKDPEKFLFSPPITEEQPIIDDDVSQFLQDIFDFGE